jgi:hypothetical protein
MARSPPDDSALQIHVPLSPWAASHRSARNLKQESQLLSRRNWALRKNRRRAESNDEVLWPGAREKRCRLLARVWPGQYHRGRHTRLASRDSSSCAKIAANIQSKGQSSWGKGTADSCEDTPSRPHATTTPYDPSPPRRATTTHVTTQVKTLLSPITLYSIQNL